jgi:hypothetical protein
MLNNEKIRDVIDTVTSKAVLILGRFTDERKALHGGRTLLERKKPSPPNATAHQTQQGGSGEPTQNDRPPCGPGAKS